MDKKTKRKIISIMITLVVVSAILLALSYDFFLNVDYRTNTDFHEINVSSDSVRMDSGITSTRKYFLIYDPTDELSVDLKENINRTLDILKVDTKVFSIDEFAGTNEINPSDYIIATFRHWYENEKAVNIILEAIEMGASLLVANLPDEDEFLIENSKDFGIIEFGKPEIVSNFVVKDDIILGFEKGEKITALAIEEFCFNIDLDPNSKVYLESDNGVPLYFTVKYEQGTIGFYNGENLTEKYMDGLITGMLGALEGDFIYPIINTGIVFIDDWPSPIKGYNESIDQQYGMTIDEFIKYIWWPDIISLAKEYGVSYVGQYVLSYNDIINPPFDVDDAQFDVSMYSFGKQIVKYGGEFGLHGYNHQPLYFSDYPSDSNLGYNKWDNIADATSALNYAKASFLEHFPDYKMNCYVPPSNIIDETGIEVVKEVLGTPVIISGIYLEEPPLVTGFDVKVEDGVIYFPRFSTGSFLDDGEKLNIGMSMSMYGIFSHFIHPDDVLDSTRSKGYSWDKMRLELTKIIDYVHQRYPFLEYSSATECGNKIGDWYYTNYTINYGESEIKINCSKNLDSHSLILYTSKQILESEKYEFIKCGESSYYIKFQDEAVTIKLKGGQ